LLKAVFARIFFVHLRSRCAVILCVCVFVFVFVCVCVMMIIAFITIKSSSVPLIEGLCAQTYFTFEISMVLLTSSSFLFCERKHMLKENQKAVHLVQTSTCSPAYIYTCVLRTPHGIYVCAMTTVHLDFFRALQVSRPDIRAHIR